MNVSQAAWELGISDYKRGVAYQNNPYRNIDEGLADDWLEGWQMASYHERQNSTVKSIN
tara:strand:- start:275 stop:451 length:177 start_codon:yes stop_codon:yes gene_type:complete